MTQEKNKEKYYALRDQILGGRKKLERMPWNMGLIRIMQEAAIRAETCGISDKSKVYKLRCTEEFNYYNTGAMMERDSMVLDKMNDEVERSREILQKTFDEARKTNDLLEPQLVAMVKRLRDTRMTVTTELQKSLNMMKDVRRFFFDKDHHEEIRRLKEFITLAEQLRMLIQDGTMDAITDAILKLQIGEETNGESKR